jgi:hypothetical protein
MLRHHTRHIRGGRAKLAAARELIALVSEPAKTHDPVDEAIREEVRRLGERTDALLYHDDLAEPNTPVYFHEFAADAARSGLGFLAEADLSSLMAAEVTADVRRTVAAMDRLEREQYLDFVRLRRYRESLLCHAELAVVPEIEATRATDLHAYASTRLLASGLDAANGADEDGHALKELLVARWPHAIRVADLHESLAQRGYLRSGAEESIKALAVRLFAAGSINLRFHAPPLATAAGTHPAVFPPARCAARDHDVLPNVYHEGVRILDPAVRSLVQSLDGRHNRRELAEAVGGRYAGALGAARLEESLAGLAGMAMLVA